MVQPHKRNQFISPYCIVVVEGGVKRITNVKAGDKIETRSGYAAVTMTFKSTVELYRITTSKGFIEANKTQKFLIEERQQDVPRRLRYLRRGDKIVVRGGYDRIESVELVGLMNAYGFEFEDEQWFYCDNFLICGCESVKAGTSD